MVCSCCAALGVQEKELERIFELPGTRNKFIDSFHLGNSL
jgi:hypothetical protein